MGWFKNLFKTGQKIAQDKAEEIIKSQEFKETVEKALRKKIVDAVNRKVDIPIMTERQEAVLFGVIYDVLTTAGIKFIKSKI